jgi:hypothetical protein
MKEHIAGRPGTERRTTRERFHHLKPKGLGFEVLPYGAKINWDEPAELAKTAVTVWADYGDKYPDEDGIEREHGADGHHFRSLSVATDSSFSGRRISHDWKEAPYLDRTRNYS